MSADVGKELVLACCGDGTGDDPQGDAPTRLLSSWIEVE